MKEFYLNISWLYIHNKNIVLFSALKYNSQQILDIVFILRVLRLIRIVDSIQR